MTDQQILDHLKQNKHSAALKGLYNVLPDVKKYIRANSGTDNDATDMFQDALVILCNKVQAGNFELAAPLKNYLLAVVRNCWLQELRLRNKLPKGETDQDVAAEDLPDEAAFIYAKNAFSQLGEKCRQLLILFYYKKESFKEIAAKLSFNDEKTAKNQKYRCLQKAKENYLTLSKNGGHE